MTNLEPQTHTHCFLHALGNNLKIFFSFLLLNIWSQFLVLSRTITDFHYKTFFESERGISFTTWNKSAARIRKAHCIWRDIRLPELSTAIGFLIVIVPLIFTRYFYRGHNFNHSNGPSDNLAY